MGIGSLAVLTATLAMNSGQWAVVSGQRVTGVTPTSGQWLVASGQRVTGVTGITLTAAENPQVKLGEEPADPAKEKAAAVTRARNHLVKVLEVREEDVALESATPATWPNAALGCPEKDRMYAQVVTNGYKVILEVNGKKHEVHVAGPRAVVCPASPAR